MTNEKKSKVQPLDRTVVLDIGTPNAKPPSNPESPGVTLTGTVVIGASKLSVEEKPSAALESTLALGTEVEGGRGASDYDEIREARKLLRAAKRPPTSTHAPFQITARQVHPLREVSTDPPPWKEPMATVQPVVNPLLDTLEARSDPPRGSREKASRPAKTKKE